MRENAAYMESYEARINLMKTAWQEFSLTMGDAVIGDSIILLTNSLTSMANVFTDVVDTVGLLPPILGTVGLVTGLISEKFRVATISAITFGKGLTSLGVSARTAKIALQSLMASTVVGVAFVGIGMALEGLIKLFSRTTEAQETYFENLNKNIQETKTTITSLENLQSKLESSNITQEEKNELYKELSGISNDVIDHYTSEGVAVNKTDAEIKKLIETKKEQLRIQERIAAMEGLANLSLDTSEIAKSKKNVAKTSSSLDEALFDSERASVVRNFIDANNIRGTIGRNDYMKLRAQIESEIEKAFQGFEGADKFKEDMMNDFLDYSDDQLEEFYTSLEGRIKRVGYLQGVLEEEQANLDKNILDFKSFALNKISYTATVDEINDSGLIQFMSLLVDSYAESADFINKSSEDIDKEFSNMMSSVIAKSKSESIDFSTLINEKDVDSLINIFPELESKIIGAFKSMSDASQTVTKNIIVYDQFGEEIDRFASMADVASAGIVNLQEANEGTEDGFIRFTGVVNNSTENLENLSKQVDNLLSELSNLNNVIDQVSKGESLNAEEVSKLIRAYPELESRIIQTANGYSIEKEALELVRDSKLDLLQTTQLAENGITTAVYTQLQARLSNYDIELGAIQTLADARSAMYAIMGNQFGLTDEEAKMVDSVHKIARLRETFSKLYSNPAYGVSAPKPSKSSGNKDEAKLQDATDARIDSINKQALVQSKLNDILKDSVDSEAEVAVQIQANTSLSSGYLKEIELLNGANNQLIKERAKLQSDNSNYDMSSWIDANGNVTESYVKLYNSMKSGSAQESLQGLLDKYNKYTQAITKNKDAVYDLEDANRNLLTSIKKLEEEQLEIRKDSADKIIDNYKKMLEKEKELRLKANEELSKAEDKRHSDKIKQLEEEYDAIERVINSQLKALDLAHDEEDFNKSLNKLNQEKLKIQNKIDILSADDSAEALYKRNKLLEELATKEEEITELRTERERQLVTDSLKDALDERKKTNEEAKKSENDKHDSIIDGIERQKEELERYYEERLTDEEYFYNMKQNLLSNDTAVVLTQLETIKSAYKNFYQELLNVSSIYGQKLVGNMLYSYQQDEKSVSDFSGNYANNTPSTGLNAQKQAAWNEYLSNKQKAESMGGSKGVEFYQLKARNDALRTQYGFEDGSYAQLSKKVFSAETGGMTPAFKGGKFLLAHEKEMVLNKQDTSNLLETVKLNTTFWDKMIQSIKNFSLPTLQPNLATSGSPSFSFDKFINIENLNASNQQDLNKFYNQLDQKLKQQGVVRRR